MKALMDKWAIGKQALAAAMMLFAYTVYGGEYAADFLRIGVGARPMAMGGSYVAIANDATAFYWNPAGVAQPHRYSFHLDHVPMFGGLAQYNAAGASMSLDKNMAINLGWIRLGVDEIPRYGSLQGSSYDRLTQGQYRSTGQAEGYFADTEDAVLLSFGRKEYLYFYLGSGLSAIAIPAELSYGISGKFIRHLLDDQRGTGQGIDAGCSIRLVSRHTTNREPDSWLGLGLLTRDVSTTNIVWSTASKHRDEVRPLLQTGLAASSLFRNLQTRVTLSVDKEFGFYKEVHAGGEVRFFDIVALRAGYYDKNWTAGAGLSFLGASVDYAFIPNELANTHRVSGSFCF
jgi:hypothetical protein